MLLHSFQLKMSSFRFKFSLLRLICISKIFTIIHNYSFFKVEIKNLPWTGYIYAFKFNHKHNMLNYYYLVERVIEYWVVWNIFVILYRLEDDNLITSFRSKLASYCRVSQFSVADRSVVWVINTSSSEVRQWVNW